MMGDSSEQPASLTPSTELPAVPKISKNQQKKLRRLEMKMKFRMEKRKFERERKKEKRKQAIEQGISLPPCRKQLRNVCKEPIDITVVIDSSFEEHMVENDMKKLIKQVQHCYAINRRAEQPFKYCVSSYGGKVQELVENLAGTQSWDVQWLEKSYDECFSKENIVYLAAESSNVLTTLDEGKVYVIGGLVDHNSKKGLCYKLACEKGIAHAQLPISNYIDMNCRKVLTIDHVFEILQKYYTQKDWESAFFSVIPKRKGAQSKGNSSNSAVTSEETDKGDKIPGESGGNLADNSIAYSPGINSSTDSLSTNNITCSHGTNAVVDNLDNYDVETTAAESDVVLEHSAVKDPV